jgi:hypothetical protein
MKKLLFTLVVLSILSSCKEKGTSTHADKHSSYISFVVSNNANIGSYNVYLNDDLVGQISSNGVDSATKYSYMHADITEHPALVNYTVEPMYYDSTNANSEISLKLTVDEQIVAETSPKIVTYQEMISLSHIVD